MLEKIKEKLVAIIFITLLLGLATGIVAKIIIQL